MMSKRRIDWAIYAAFIVLIMLVPLIMDSFWLNRLAKYLVFGMLGIAVALLGATAADLFMPLF
ncbi:MAG: hypothetical protein E6614_35265, partial [Bradyrhizobium sp.]|nr:hypothetical protein [Bradyrhizobium sp.]